MSGPSNQDVMFQTLLSYKKLALDSLKHPTIMKDRTVIQFLAYSLDSEDEQIVETALQTMDLLIKNPKNQNSIRSTFGIVEALKCTSERVDLPQGLKDFSRSLWKNLETPAPSYRTRNRTKITLSTESIKSNSDRIHSTVYTFIIFGLNPDTRSELENVLVGLKGVVSVLVDVNHQRCVVRVVKEVTPEIIAETIASRTTMEPHLVVFNKENQEVLKDVLSNSSIKEYFDLEKSCQELPPYLEEEEPPVKEKAVLSFDQFRTSASSLIRTAAEFFQNSFYW